MRVRRRCNASTCTHSRVKCSSFPTKASNRLLFLLFACMMKTISFPAPDSDGCIRSNTRTRSLNGRFSTVLLSKVTIRAATCSNLDRTLFQRSVMLVTNWDAALALGDSLTFCHRRSLLTCISCSNAEDWLQN